MHRKQNYFQLIYSANEYESKLIEKYSQYALDVVRISMFVLCAIVHVIKLNIPICESIWIRWF